MGIWVHKVSFYLPWKFNKDLFLFLLNSQLFLNKCRPCNGANFFPPPFIQAVGASKGCTDPENWGSALEHPTNSTTYFKVTFKETFLDWNNCCQQLAKTVLIHINDFCPYTFSPTRHLTHNPLSALGVGNSQQKPFSATKTRQPHCSRQEFTLEEYFHVLCKV